MVDSLRSGRNTDVAKKHICWTIHCTILTTITSLVSFPCSQPMEQVARQHIKDPAKTTRTSITDRSESLLWEFVSDRHKEFVKEPQTLHY